jgi:16S rRNA (cytosine967-C5)-methyltransferase
VQTVQELAARTVAEVLDGRSLKTTLAQLWPRHSSLTESQRGAIQDLGYGTLRELGRMRGLLRRMVDREPTDPLLRALLLVALFQLKHTRAAPYAVVNGAVSTGSRLISPAFKGLINALLRRYLRESAQLDRTANDDDEALYSYPQWWIDRVRQEYPQHWVRILEAGNAHPPLTLRINRRRVDTVRYASMLADSGLPYQSLGEVGMRLEKPVPVSRIPGFADGWVSVQDAGAQWAPQLLDLRPGQRVLDACAAPGGKAAHMLEAVEVDLTAMDCDAGRLQRVADNFARLGLSARTLCADAGKTDTWWDGQAFERILADVPCSASGVVSRHPDIKWLRRPQDLIRFSEQQRCLLDALWKVLAPGGKLLYVTCSIFNQENELQIQRFMTRWNDAERLSLESFPETDGQLLPGNEHDGFYYALLSKKHRT